MYFKALFAFELVLSDFTKSTFLDNWARKLTLINNFVLYSSLKQHFRVASSLAYFSASPTDFWN